MEENWANYFNEVNIAIITILLPLIIAVISEYISTKKGLVNGVGFQKLDLDLILKDVFDIKLVLSSLLFIFSPSFLWITIIPLQFFLLFLWIVGLYFLIMIILSTVSWIKGDKFKFRISFLSNLLKNKQGLATSWFSVWKTEGKEFQNYEKKFFNIFIKQIRSMLENKELEIASNILLDFKNNLDNRNQLFFIRSNGGQDPIRMILNLHFIIWKAKRNENLLPREDLFNYRSNFTQLEEIFKESLLRISNNPNWSFPFLSSLEQFLKKILNLSINDRNNYKYIDYFLERFYQFSFKEILELGFWNSLSNIWREWIITSDNLSKNNISTITFIEYLKWTRLAIVDQKTELYGKIEDISDPLLPKAELSQWGNFLDLIFSRERKIEFLIKKERIIKGAIYGVINISSDSKEELHNETEKDIERRLSENKLLIKKLYEIWKYYLPSKELIGNYKKEIQNLKIKYSNNEGLLQRITEYENLIAVLEESISEAHSDKTSIS